MSLKYELKFVGHLITTSKNLFQSEGLNLLKHIDSPLISLSMLF